MVQLGECPISVRGDSKLIIHFDSGMLMDAAKGNKSRNKDLSELYQVVKATIHWKKKKISKFQKENIDKQM